MGVQLFSTDSDRHVRLQIKMVGLAAVVVVNIGYDFCTPHSLEMGIFFGRSYLYLIIDNIIKNSPS